MSNKKIEALNLLLYEIEQNIPFKDKQTQTLQNLILVGNWTIV